MVNKIRAALPDIPIVALVDADPDGIKIMMTYRFGTTLRF
jgi:DNA topoisomerase VI subunit A